MKVPILWLLLLLSGHMQAQKTEDLKWFKAEELALGGKFDTKGLNPFQRFPDSMKYQVRERVWDLSQNSAGVHADFRTNSPEIIVRYQVKEKLEFPHMPATGVSGVDLYTCKDEVWKWVKGNYSFRDTITYKFRLKKSVDTIQNKVRLYLPLYNTVSYMEIGIHTDADFTAIPRDSKQPIVVYGTSITQGACAGRPGTAWTAILSRKINTPLVNYGFSGNGRLEEEIISYLSNTHAEVFILDCLANFTSGQGLDAEEAKKRLIKSVQTLRDSHPQTPIVLTDHAGYPHGEVYPPEKERYLKLNEANREAFEILKVEGVQHIFLLENKNLGLDQDDFIDGVHPNDAGMRKYAEAFFELLAEILN